MQNIGIVIMIILQFTVKAHLTILSFSHVLVIFTVHCGFPICLGNLFAICDLWMSYAEK